MSYLVGCGDKYPVHVHHRGASIAPVSLLPSLVGCVKGFEEWYKRLEANPNVIHGALVGGPNSVDEFIDDRSNYEQTEPTLSGTAPLVGLFCKFHSLSGNSASKQTKLISYLLKNVIFSVALMVNCLPRFRLRRFLQAKTNKERNHFLQAKTNKERHHFLQAKMSLSLNNSSVSTFHKHVICISTINHHHLTPAVLITDPSPKYAAAPQQPKSGERNRIKTSYFKIFTHTHKH